MCLRNSFSNVFVTIKNKTYQHCRFSAAVTAAPGSVAVTGDSDGDWVMGGGRWVMVAVVVMVTVHVYRVSLVSFCNN